MPSDALDDDAAAALRNETPTERLDRNWSEILQEMRVAQTGTQIISGFLLAVAFQSRFTELDSFGLTLYLVLVALAAVATALALAPVSAHRALFRRQVKGTIVSMGNRYLIAQLVVVALLTVGVVSLIFDFVLNRTAGIVAGVIGLIAIGIVWLVLPRMRVSESRPGPNGAPPELPDR